jgi:flagellar protein FliO/FliZ
MDALPSGLQALLWFVAVVAAIPFALWLLRRSPVGAAAVPRGPLRLVATLPIAPGQRLLTVEVGAGEQRRWLVLGVTAQQISALHEMAPADAAAAAGGEAVPPLAQLLRQLGVNARESRRDA